MPIAGNYLRKALSVENLMKFTQNIVDALKPYVKCFDSIVFRGVSGALVGPSVAMALNKEMVVIRKKDGSHSYCQAEGFVSTQSYVIVDDLVDSGATLGVIKRTIQEWKESEDAVYACHYSQSSLEDCRKPAKCFAVVLYLADYTGQNGEESKPRYFGNMLHHMPGESFLVFTTMNGHLQPVAGCRN